MADDEWTVLQKDAFRFVFCYCTLYFIFIWSDYLTGAVPVVQRWVDHLGAPWRLFVPWFGKHVLHLPKEIVHVGYGSDTAYTYVLVLCFSILAVAISCVWTLLDAGSARYPRLHALLRVVLRFGLGITMLGYGFGKIFPLQFRPPELGAIMQPLGRVEPMALLWTFMGYSRPYSIFAGSLEVLGGVLLLFKRTTTLGALIVAAVMANVVMLNLSYDVQIKIFSSHLLFFTLILLAPDFRRLIDLFVLQSRLNSPVESTAFVPRLLSIVKVVSVGFLLLFFVRSSLHGANALVWHVAKPPLYGIYDVDDFISEGVSEVPAIPDASRWREVAFEPNGSSSGMMIGFIDDSFHYYRTEYDPTDKLVTVRTGEGGSTLSYSQPDIGVVRLEGSFVGQKVRVTLHRVDESKLPLFERKFRWIRLW